MNKEQLKEYEKYYIKELNKNNITQNLKVSDLSYLKPLNLGLFYSNDIILIKSNKPIIEQKKEVLKDSEKLIYNANKIKTEQIADNVFLNLPLNIGKSLLNKVVC